MYIVTAGSVLNGAAPYLGIKSQSTWTMFSNLRLENGSSNHFLVPASFQIFGELIEIVHVNSTDFKFLKSFHRTVWGEAGSDAAKSFAQRYGLDSHLVVNRPRRSGILSPWFGEARGLDGMDRHKVNFAITRATLSRLVSWEGLAMSSRATFFIDLHDKGRAARFEVVNGTVVRDDAQLAKAQPFWRRKLMWSRSYQPEFQGRCSH